MAGWNGSAHTLPPDWPRIRATVLNAQPTCRLRYAVCTGRSTEADHIIPRARGGSHQLSNLQGVCAPCHALKTIAERPTQRRPTEPHPGVLP